LYRHLMVPIDSTDLSIEVVGNAVGLARAVGARITFFHALDDGHAFDGQARELLAKAEAAARALGVPCEAKQVRSDKPAAAIVEAAHGNGCDLIFMASHGDHGNGTALASQTLSVLMNAGLPVLVSSTGDPKPPAHAIGVIRDEHRSLAAVLHAWMHALAAARSHGRAPDTELMRAIVRYLQAFPVALHHPKEEKHLFMRLRKRTDSVNAELDELERQHRRDQQLVADLAGQVEALAAGSDAKVAALATQTLDDAVQAYAKFLWDHLGREEGVILPAAHRHLSEADWTELDAAFKANRDPGFGTGIDTAEDYGQLLSRIVNAAQDLS
jgi:nucleotide-binding universal stress UspA family protein/hemerythrin-like domain-containing protein